MITLAQLMEAFNRLDNASQRVECALPSQMTEACANLVYARKEFRSVLQLYARDNIRARSVPFQQLHDEAMERTNGQRPVR